MKKSKAQVQGTNDYNTVSKCSMIKNGYFKDKYVSCFVTKSNRRAPLIHLGYYMRMLTVDFTLRTFLDAMSDLPLQIISCGAGFDTSFFRFAEEGLLHPRVLFYEVEFEEVVERKAACILKSDAIQKCIGPLHENPAGFKGLLTSQYKLLTGDLQYPDVLEANLMSIGMKFDLPTLLLAECSICYMDEESGSKLIEWAASRFTDATFVTYEQVYPDDGFGTVMKKHFEDMKSPLLQLNKYPHLEAQEERYTSRGWTTCRAWTAYEMFLRIASPEERSKIVTLEPFDEFEEWHLQGCHFALIVASKGSLVDWFPKAMNSRISENHCGDRRPEIQWEVSTAPVHRFAHKSVFVNQGDENSVLVLGGFGPSSESMHGRRSEILRISTNENEDDSCSEICIEEIISSKDMKLDALHHSCTQLSNQAPDGSNRVFVYGGRYSPCKPVNTWPVILNIKHCRQETTVTLVETIKSDVIPEPRWRHSALCIGSNTEDHIAVFGGRTTDMKVLNDLCLWTVKAVNAKIMWREVKQLQESLWPPARFSHTANLWKERTMIVCGGLGKDLLPLGDIWSYSMDSETWLDVPICGMLPRYSHTAAIYNNKLILIGGVNILPGRQPGICVVDLINKSCIEYSLPAQNPSYPVMLHNHTSEVIIDKTLLIIGGGGNCFSFGTIFNSYVMKIHLDELI